MPWKISDFSGSGIERPALDHIGFKVESLSAFKADVEKHAHLYARKKTGRKKIPSGMSGKTCSLHAASANIKWPIPTAF